MDDSGSGRLSRRRAPGSGARFCCAGLVLASVAAFGWTVVGDGEGLLGRADVAAAATPGPAGATATAEVVRTLPRSVISPPPAPSPTASPTAPSPPSPSATGSPIKPVPPASAGMVTVHGSGFGHGVGMSQYGALGMAAAGASVGTILTHYYAGTRLSGYPDDVTLRVNVVDRGTSVTLSTSPLADGGGALQLVTSAGQVIGLPAGSSAAIGVEGGSLTVRTSPSSGGAVSLTTTGLTARWSGAAGLAGPASVLTLASRSSHAGSASGKTRRYRWGAVQLLPVARSEADGSTRTRIEAVAVLNLHSEYLRGVAEVPSSWPAAALQAQVVAARNYALTSYQHGTSTSCGGCHLYDDTRSQVYQGWPKESERGYGTRWVAAVNATQPSATSGLTVLYAGRPITAYYSSSSGGRTRDAANAWGSPVPYLRSVPDPWSLDAGVNPGYAHWTRQVRLSTLAALFGLPELVAVRVSGRDDSGAATSVTATSAGGLTRTLTGGRVSAGLGLPAPWITGFTLPS